MEIMDIKWKILAQKDPEQVFAKIYDMQLQYKTIAEIAVILGWNGVQSFYTRYKDKYLPKMIKEKGFPKCLNCGKEITHSHRKRFCSGECSQHYYQKTRTHTGKRSSLQYTDEQLDSLAESLVVRVKAEKKRISQEKEFICILEMRLKGCSWEEIATKINRKVEYTRLIFYRYVKKSFLSESDNYDVLIQIAKRKKQSA